MTTSLDRRGPAARVARAALLAAVAAASIAAAPPPGGHDPAGRGTDATSRTATRTSTHAAAERRAQEAEEVERRRLDALRRELERIEGETARADQLAAEKPREAPSEPSIFGAFFKMVFVLGGVCALAYLLLGKLLPRLMKIEAPVAKQRLLTVIDRLPLDQRRAILVLRIADAFYLVGASDQGISLLSKLDPDEVEAALARAQAGAKAEAGGLASVFARRR